MFRSLCALLIFGVAYGGVDAAVDLQADGACDEQIAHDMHSDWECSSPAGDTPPPDTDAHTKHYCHCAMHAAPVPSSDVMPLASGAHAVPCLATHLHGTGPKPPPVRPPKP